MLVLYFNIPIGSDRSKILPWGPWGCLNVLMLFADTFTDAKNGYRPTGGFFYNPNCIFYSNKRKIEILRFFNFLFIYLYLYNRPPSGVFEPKNFPVNPPLPMGMIIGSFEKFYKTKNFSLVNKLCTFLKGCKKQKLITYIYDSIIFIIC